jgi:DNA polymerase-3 subunit epsilon
LDSITLTNPLVVFDLETTGVTVDVDRVTQFAGMKIWPNGEIEEYETKVNPLMQVSEQILELTHLTQEELDAAFTFHQLAEYLHWYMTCPYQYSTQQWFDHVDYCGYNSNNFDIPFITAEFERVNFEFDISKSHCPDPMLVYKKMEPRDLTAAYKHYCGKDLEGAHDALTDIRATWEVLQGQVAMYPDMPTDVEGIAQFGKKDGWIDMLGKFAWENNRPIVNFGKHKGCTLEYMSQYEPGFLRWMLKNDFPVDAKQIAQDALDKKYPIR